MNQQLLGDQWYPLLKDEIEKEYFKKLKDSLRQEYTTNKCYPSPTDIFKVFQLCPLEKVRVVMLSQDPYPSQHAHGLAFSSMQHDTPYSLQIILREVDRDIVRTENYKEFKEAFPTNNLTKWVQQGVFLLNVNLTVRAGIPMSHNNLGWQEFTTRVLELLIADKNPKVFVTLGAEANKTFISIVTRTVVDESNNHYILEVGHPASGAHGKDKFSGCRIFSKINLYFLKNSLPLINWKLNEKTPS